MIDVPYRPRDPQSYNPPIGMIGCGGITEHHLDAYRNAGYRVVALCDLDPAAASKRAAEFFPEAEVYADYRQLLARTDIEVVDVTTHPPERPAIIRACLEAGKHVLSQKPFVLDLDVGEELVQLAEQHQRKLAVNQNGRWAPHFSYIRNAVTEGLLGDIAGIHMSVHWDHTWTAGTPFEEVHHLILYDFAIHWFDMVQCIMGDQTARSVFATTTRTHRQSLKPPLLGQAMMQFPHAQASLSFDADTDVGPNDRVYVTGSNGSIHAHGASYQDISLTMHWRDPKSDSDEINEFQPKLSGKWFPDGFHGTMGELLCSIEENREPSICAASNLRSLALCFAALESAETGQATVPGDVRRMPGTS